MTNLTIQWLSDDNPMMVYEKINKMTQDKETK